MSWIKQDFVLLTSFGIVKYPDQRYQQTLMSGLPQERNWDWKNYNYHGGNEVSDIFMNMFTSLLWI
jgi:hypothetical protein